MYVDDWVGCQWHTTLFASLLLIPHPTLSAHTLQNIAMATERVVLPKNVTPDHYDIKLWPNLETFIFTGEVGIEYVS